MVKVGTTDQLDDFLTKPVSARWLVEKSPKLGLEFRGGRFLCCVDWFPDGSWITQMVGAGTNVYVFDRCINVTMRLLQRGHHSCTVACLFVLRQSSEFSSDAHSRRSATIHASPNLVCPSAHLSLCTMLTREQLVCPPVLTD